MTAIVFREANGRRKRRGRIIRIIGIALLAAIGLVVLWKLLPQNIVVRWGCEKTAIFLRVDEVAGTDAIKRVYADRGFDFVSELESGRGHVLVFEKCAHSRALK